MRSPVASSPSLSSAWTVVLFLVAVLGGFVALGGCAAEERSRGDGSSPHSDTTARPSMTDGLIQGTGTIRYVDLEGGFYGLVGDEGTRYDPTPLPDSLRVDGLRIRFEATKKSVMTTRMWGTPVRVLHVERIGDEND